LVLREARCFIPALVKAYAAERNNAQGSASSLAAATITRHVTKQLGPEGRTTHKRDLGQKGHECRSIGESAAGRDGTNSEDKQQLKSAGKGLRRLVRGRSR